MSKVQFHFYAYRTEDSIYLVFYLLVDVWKDATAMCPCFEVMVRKDTIALHLYFEVSFYKWSNLVTNVKHSFSHNTNFKIDITVF